MTAGANTRRFARLVAVALVTVPVAFAGGCGGGDDSTPPINQDVGDPGRSGQTGDTPFPKGERY